MPARAASSPRHFTAILLVLALASLALRVGIAEALHPIELQGDENYYVRVATQLATRGEHRDPQLGAVAQWPPGNSWWLSLFVDEREVRPKGIAPEVLRGLVRAQCGLGAILVALVGVLGRRLFTAQVGLTAAALVGLYPGFVVYSHSLWAAMLFLVLSAAGLVLAVGAQQRDAVGSAALAGLLFGLAALTRELGLLLAVVAGLWLMLSPGSAAAARARLRGVVLVGAALATVAPWTLRNQLELGSVVPVSTIGWMSLRIGNTIAQDDWMRPDRAALTAFHRRYFSEPDEVARMDLSRREALAAIAGAQPGWAAKKLVRNTAQLFSLDSALFSKLRAGAYGRPSRAVLRAVVAASAFAYVALIVLGSLGAALDANGSRRWLLVGWIAAVVALHVLANASGRYRLPMLPVFALYAAALLVRVWRGELRVAEFSTVRGAVAAAWLVFFGAVALRYEAGYFVGSLWNAPGLSG